MNVTYKIIFPIHQIPKKPNNCAKACRKVSRGAILVSEIISAILLTSAASIYMGRKNQKIPNQQINGVHTKLEVETGLLNFLGNSILHTSKFDSINNL